MNIEISDTEHKAIRLAIQKAEKKTSAEIYTVLAARSDNYIYTGMFFFAFWIFLVSAFLVLLLEYYGLSITALHFVLAQLAAFMCGYLVLKLFPKLAVLLTPQRIKYHRAHLNGSKQFLAHGIHNTEGRTGVLIFVSLEERYAEILVDAAVEESIGRDFWLEAVGELIALCKAGNICQGYVSTIENVSIKLSNHFPNEQKNLNELEDKLVIL